MLFSQMVIESSFGSKHKVTKWTLIFLFDVLLFDMTAEILPILKVLLALPTIKAPAIQSNANLRSDVEKVVCKYEN